MAFNFELMKPHILYILLFIFTISCFVNKNTNVEVKNGLGFVIEKDGCFLLKTKNDEFYPINLEKQLEINGLRVKFSYFEVNIESENCNQFQAVEIIEIIPYRK